MDEQINEIQGESNTSYDSSTRIKISWIFRDVFSTGKRGLRQVAF